MSLVVATREDKLSDSPDKHPPAHVQGSNSLERSKFDSQLSLISMLPNLLVGCLAFLKFGGVCELDASQYLHVPSSEEVQSDRATFGPIEEALRALAQNGAEGSAAIIERAAKLKARHLDDGHEDEGKLAVLEMIGALGDHRPDSCSPELASAWLRSFAVLKLREGGHELKPIGEYILRAGRDKFLECASQVEAEFREVTLKGRGSKAKVVKFLNNAEQKFLSRLWTLSANKLKSAESFRLIDHYKSREFRQFVERRTMSERGAPSAYLRKYCNYIRHTIGQQFELLNLGRALGQYEIKDNYLARVNEYHRIFCVESQRPEVKKYLDAMVIPRFSRAELEDLPNEGERWTWTAAN